MFEQPGWLDACQSSPSCVVKVGVDTSISAGQFKNNVCPKDPASGLTSNGQVFAFSEHFVSPNLLRPGTIGACYCNSHLADANSVVQCTSNQPQTVSTVGASQCEFEYQKLGNGAAVINASGQPSNINAAIVGSPQCPVADIKTKDVRVCNDVIPIQKSFKIQGNALSFQFDEGLCRNSLAQPLPVGESVIIYVKGSFTSDGSQFEGGQSVLVK